MTDRLIYWLGREGWIGLVPMLLAAAWFAREAWKLRQARRRLRETFDDKALGRWRRWTDNALKDPR